MNVPGRLDVYRGRPRPDDREVDILEPNTDALARKHAHDSAEARITPPCSLEKETKTDQSLFRDPAMTPSVDFQSQDGLKQAAKKKKAAAKNAAKAKWADDEEEDGTKKDDGGDGNDGGDNKGGDTGAGGSDDKKDETNGDGDANGDANPDDTWDSFMPAKSKKKGKKGKTEDPIPDPTTAAEENTELFHEIKLDDAPTLDLSFDTGTKSSGGFGAWGSSWNTGTAR